MSTCGAARRAAKCERERRRHSFETVEQTAARRPTDRSRSNRRRSVETPQTEAQRLQTVVVQDGVEVVRIILGNCHVEPQATIAHSAIVARRNKNSCRRRCVPAFRKRRRGLPSQ